MGFLSRFFSKNELETIQDLEKELEAVARNAQVEFIALVGIKGKLKGLDIISVIGKDAHVDSNQLKRYVAKLVEVYLRVETLQLIQEAGTPLQFLQLFYTEDLNFCVVPIHGNDRFIVVAVAPNVARILKHLEREKITQKLNLLFAQKSPEEERPPSL